MTPEERGYDTDGLKRDEMESILAGHEENLVYRQYIFYIIYNNYILQL